MSRSRPRRSLKPGAKMWAELSLATAIMALATVVGPAPSASAAEHNGTAIPIMCTAQGNAVSGPWGTETVWDYTSWSSQDGWVSDARVDTGTEGAVAPSC